MVAGGGGGGHWQKQEQRGGEGRQGKEGLMNHRQKVLSLGEKTDIF